MCLLNQIRKLAETPYDGFIFSPHPEKENHTHIESFSYVTPGEAVKGSDMGSKYEILFLEPSEEYDDMILEDRFVAILSDPVIYLHHLVTSGFFGIIGKKTTTSDLFFDSVMEESV